MADVDLRSQVQWVLKRVPEELGFYDSIGKFRVSAAAFLKIHELVKAGKVRVTKYKGDFAAVYLKGSNTISIRSSYSGPIRREAVILHEATHCLQDFHKAVYLGPLNEIASNVAENMFRRARLRQAKTPISDPKSEIDKAADIVAERLEKIADPLKRVLKLGDPDVDALANILWSHPDYSKGAGKATAPDGI